jgi:molecular chaperone GrpE
MAHALRDVGVELLEPAGETFDPGRHESVGEEVADAQATPGTVARTLRPGVLDSGRVVRPAQVVIYTSADGRRDDGGVR